LPLLLLLLLPPEQRYTAGNVTGSFSAQLT